MKTRTKLTALMCVAALAFSGGAIAKKDKEKTETKAPKTKWKSQKNEDGSRDVVLVNKNGDPLPNPKEAVFPLGHCEGEGCRSMSKDLAKQLNKGSVMDPNPPSGDGGTASSGGLEKPPVNH